MNQEGDVIPPPPAPRVPARRELVVLEQIGALVGGVLLAWDLYERAARRLTRQ